MNAKILIARDYDFIPEKIAKELAGNPNTEIENGYLKYFLYVAPEGNFINTSTVNSVLRLEYEISLDDIDGLDEIENEAEIMEFIRNQENMENAWFAEMVSWFEQELDEKLLAYVRDSIEDNFAIDAWDGGFDCLLYVGKDGTLVDTEEEAAETLTCDCCKSRDLWGSYEAGGCDLYDSFEDYALDNASEYIDDITRDFYDMIYNWAVKNLE